jgi:hypothetical protein
LFEILEVFDLVFRYVVPIVASFDFDELEIKDELILEVNVEIEMPYEVNLDLVHRGLVDVSLPYYP